MNLREIARKLETEHCAKHRQKATAIVKGDSIELICCCDEFKTKLIEKMESEIEKQVEDDIKNIFKF